MHRNTRPPFLPHSPAPLGPSRPSTSSRRTAMDKLLTAILGGLPSCPGNTLWRSLMMMGYSDASSCRHHRHSNLIQVPCHATSRYCQSSAAPLGSLSVLIAPATATVLAPMRTSSHHNAVAPSHRQRHAMPGMACTYNHAPGLG